MIYVLAYPEFAPSTADALATFRAAHEPQRARLVPPHVTLVFGLRNFSAEAMADQCRRIASEARPFKVTFADGEFIHDPLENTHKIALPCVMGADELTMLHERLYDGPQRIELNPTIPYRPHMTIATNSERSVLETISTAVLGPFPLAAQITQLELVQVADGTLSNLSSFPLG